MGKGLINENQIKSTLRQYTDDKIIEAYSDNILDDIVFTQHLEKIWKSNLLPTLKKTYSSRQKKPIYINRLTQTDNPIEFATGHTSLATDKMTAGMLGFINTPQKVIRYRNKPASVIFKKVLWYILIDSTTSMNYLNNKLNTLGVNLANILALSIGSILSDPQNYNSGQNFEVKIFPFSNRIRKNKSDNNIVNYSNIRDMKIMGKKIIRQGDFENITGIHGSLMDILDVIDHDLENEDQASLAQIMILTDDNQCKLKEQELIDRITSTYTNKSKIGFYYLNYKGSGNSNLKNLVKKIREKNKENAGIFTVAEETMFPWMDNFSNLISKDLDNHLKHLLEGLEQRVSQFEEIDNEILYNEIKKISQISLEVKSILNTIIDPIVLVKRKQNFSH